MSTVNKEIRRLRIRVEGIGSEYIELEIDKHRETIDIDANPNGNQEITRAFAELHDVVKDNYPGKLKRAWRSLYPYSLIFAISVVWATFVISVTKTYTDTTKLDLYKQVSDTSKKIDTSEVLRLMAIIESGNSNVKAEYHGFSPKMVILLILSVSFTAIMMYRPRLTLEIGKNRGEYKLRDKYENLVIFVVPGYLIATFALPWMNDIISKLLS